MRFCVVVLEGELAIEGLGPLGVVLERRLVTEEWGQLREVVLEG